MNTIVIQTAQKSTSEFILEMARRIKVKARILQEDELADLQLNKMLKKDEKNLQEVKEEKLYQILRKHGAEI